MCRRCGRWIGLRRVAVEEKDSDDAPLGGAALRSCIQGEGEPPHELLLAAVACAASGTVRGVPVQRLREDDAIVSLDLRGRSISVIAAGLLGLMLPAATSVRSLRCPSDNALRQRSQPAFPLPHRSARFPCQSPPAQVFAQVRRRLSCQRPLTRLLSHRVPPPPLAHSLEENEIGGEGASALAAVLKETKIADLGCASTSIKPANGPSSPSS